jgi:hypothetical protein
MQTQFRVKTQFSAAILAKAALFRGAGFMAHSLLNTRQTEAREQG